MIAILENGFQSLAFAVLFMVLGATLDASVPANSVEIAKLHSMYVTELRFMALGFSIVFVALTVISSLSKLKSVAGLARFLEKRHVAVGYLISSMGLICAFYYLLRFMV